MRSKIKNGILVVFSIVGLWGCPQVEEEAKEAGEATSEETENPSSGATGEAAGPTETSDAPPDTTPPLAPSAPSTPSLPIYSGGTCPEFNGMADTNVVIDFTSAGLERRFILRLPETDHEIEAPVLFSWHGVTRRPGADAAANALSTEITDTVGIQNNVILIAPYSLRHNYPSGTPIPGGIILPESEWAFDREPTNNPDLALFDDLVACLHSQYRIDLDRVWSSGFSAGGLITSYLAQHRSTTLASVAVLSGGASTEEYSASGVAMYQAPEIDIPVLLEWGGPNDIANSFSFESASLNFSKALRCDGSLVVECEGEQAHLPPPGTGPLIWRFISDHPKGVSPEPYLTGLPEDFPDEVECEARPITCEGP